MMTPQPPEYELAQAADSGAPVPVSAVPIQLPSVARSGPGPLAYAALGCVALLSAPAPLDRLTWTLEVLVLAGVYAALAAWCRARPLPSTTFLWTLWLYGFVMLIGAHWTYGHAPPGEWLRELFGLHRNPWDRVGHLFQGAVPALFVLGLLPRGTSFARRLALALLAGLATALTFEALEWLVAHLIADGAGFVQAQGDPFDSLFDVLFAVLGAGFAMLAPSENKATPRPPKNRQAGSR